MATDFEKAFALIVNIEGKDSDDPNDPGGYTRFGIAQKFHPDVDVRNLTLDGARDIYRKEYWDPAHCDALPWPVNVMVFDYAVNQYGGPAEAIRLLQKSVGTVADGLLGQNTLTAIRKAEPVELCARYMAKRALRYTGTRNFDINGEGWFFRLFKVTIKTDVKGN